MKKYRLIALTMALAMSFMVGCSTTAPSAPASSEAAAPASEASTAEKTPSKGFDGTVSFGISAPLTGTNKMNGDYVKRGAEMAAETINANGGILGKELKLVYEDEMDTLQGSVNAMTKLMNNDQVVALFGSVYTPNVVAISPTVLEKKIPFYCGDSSVNALKGDNPYYWQARMTADKTAIVFSKTVKDVLKAKNPAIIHVTDSFGNQAKDNTIRELKNIGIEVNEKNIYGFVNDEKNFTPIITQIMNSDCDAVLAFGHQMPAALICQQAEAAGLDLPRIGSSSWASAICRTNAGAAADGWYAIADWTDEITTEEGKAFAKAYNAKYNTQADMPALACHDSIMLFAEACRIAGTTTDKEAINNAMKEIKDYHGAMSIYTYNGTSSLSTVQLCTKNEGGNAKMVEAVAITAVK
ncbi:ABC transporter substrate-binding protein [Oscillospiraceae bacterium PP1C4]